MAKEHNFTASEILTPDTMNKLTQDSQIVKDTALDSNDDNISTTKWVRSAHGNTNLNAASATKLFTERGIITNLSSTISSLFDGTTDITPGISGILALENGGTGASEEIEARKNLGLKEAATYDVTNSVSASAIGITNKLVTEQDVYYGLPSLNGNKDYTSNTSIYAPISAGVLGYILKSNGAGVPSWVPITDIISPLYKHVVIFRQNSNFIYTTFVNTQSTDMNYDDIAIFLYDNGFRGMYQGGSYPATGHSDSTESNIYGIEAYKRTELWGIAWDKNVVLSASDLNYSHTIALN